MIKYDKKLGKNFMSISGKFYWLRRNTFSLDSQNKYCVNVNEYNNAIYCRSTILCAFFVMDMI